MIKCGYASIQGYSGALDILDSFSEEYAEMSTAQMEFLCGMIQDRRPSKILEVGVAAGGTTSVILRCMEKLGLDATLYSVDISTNYYRNPNCSCGFIAEELKSSGKLAGIGHELFLGKYLPEVLENIGKDIDFVVLDTVHSLPGELLDFIAVYPFLSEDAIVVLHDVVLNHFNSMEERNCFATQILYTVVSGDKYLNNADGYPNIAAFKVNNRTQDSLIDLFSALTLTWAYLPSNEEIKIYSEWYKRFYSESMVVIFEQAINLQEKTLRKLDRDTDEYIQSIFESIINGYQHILLYGAGRRGRAFMKLYRSMDYCGEHAIEFVVSDESARKGEQGVLVFNDIRYEKQDTIIILTANVEEIETKLSSSGWHWLKIPRFIWNVLERFDDI